MPRLKPLILVDRDGTLIEEKNYLSDPEGVKLLPGAVEGMKALKGAGFCVVVVSNQSGVGRGLMTMRQLQSVNRRFLRLLGARKAAPDGVYWCPHRPSASCSCRKPKLGLVKRAARDLRQSWKKSISVGDRASDVKLGQKTGGQGILVRTGYGRQWAKEPRRKGADFVAADFRAAVAWILKKAGAKYGDA